MGQVIDGAARDAALAAVKAYLRIDGGAEDALLGALTGSAAEVCEAFTGRWLIARQGTEVVGGGGWQRLSARPVRAITTVAMRDEAGAETPLPGGAYETDIDARGDGWVRVAAPSDGRVSVTFTAGLAADWSEVPEAVAQGIVRLAAHFYRMRDSGDVAAPPAAVTALWRPWRCLPFGRSA